MQEDSLFVYPCPPGYCRCELGIESKERICIHSYNHEEPDGQCACGRKGQFCKNMLMLYVCVIEVRLYLITIIYEVVHNSCVQGSCVGNVVTANLESVFF